METNIIPVWCIVDADAVFQLGNQGTSAAPTNLGDYTQSDSFVSMVTPIAHLQGSNGISELTINAPIGAQIQLYMTSYLPDSLGASLVSIAPNIPDVLSDYQLCNSALAGNYIVTQVEASDNKVTGFSVTFYLHDQAGNTYGYYYWDPQVNVVA